MNELTELAAELAALSCAVLSLTVTRDVPLVRWPLIAVFAAALMGLQTSGRLSTWELVVGFAVTAVAVAMYRQGRPAEAVAA